MDKNIRRVHPPEFKAQVVLEVLKEIKTISEIGSQYQVHPTQIKKWKETAIQGLKETFTDKNGRVLKEKEDLIDRLYKEVGQLKVELDWLKKKMGYSY